jgi:predicted nucleic acid-binding protein
VKGGVFFDSNVLIYTLAKNDPRQPTAARLLAGGGAISVQVLNEFADVARRKLRLSWKEVAEAVEAVRAFCPPPLPLAVGTHEAALGIAGRLGYRFFDSLIIASALEANCATLLSEDMQDGQVIDGRLAIRNPFRP